MTNDDRRSGRQCPMAKGARPEACSGAGMSPVGGYARSQGPKHADAEGGGDRRS